MMVPSRWIIETTVSLSSALEMRRLHATACKADDLPVTAHDSPREDRRPASGDLALGGFDDGRGHRFARGEFPEIAAVGNAHVRHRPALGRVDQPTACVEHVECADMGKRL